jgi:hypothetical protein
VAVELVQLKAPGALRVEGLGQFVQSFEGCLGVDSLDTGLPVSLEELLQLFRHPRQGMGHAVEFESLHSSECNDFPAVQDPSTGSSKCTSMMTAFSGSLRSGDDTLTTTLFLSNRRRAHLISTAHRSEIEFRTINKT